MNFKLNKMSIILILAGIICLGTGLFLLTKNKHAQEENRIEQTLEIDDVIKLKDTLINLAIADGVLTENEKNELISFANKNSLDGEAIISEAEERIKVLSTKNEVEKIDYSQKNGIDFEKYVVEKFNRKYFSIKKWRGDKYINGRYAEDTPEPDLLIEFKLGESKFIFAVECKWRQHYYKGGFEFSQKDFEKYKQYEIETNTPVFTVIGMGGTGKNPDHLYILNFRNIEYSYIKIDTLSRFEKDKTHNFFYDSKNKELR